MKTLMRQQKILLCAAGMVFAGQVAAAPIQSLLDEDFQDVSGLTAAAVTRTIQDITTNTPGQLDGSPIAGPDSAAETAVNVRRGDNAIDGGAVSEPAAIGDGNFDNFFGAAANQFLVIGDVAFGLDGNPSSGATATLPSTSILFDLAAVTLNAPLWLDISFDYVFDTNNTTASPSSDDFIAELILADGGTINLLDFTAPEAGTRGTFSSRIAYSDLAAAPASLNFLLFEYGGTGSSAVGLDNLQVSAIPEPGALALLGIGLLGLAALRRQTA